MRTYRKAVMAIAAAGALAALAAVPSYAGQWQQDGNGWWWQNDDGSYPYWMWAWIDDNIYIFGESSETVIRRYAEGSYCSRSYYEADPDLKEAVDFIISPAMTAAGSVEHLERLYNELLNKDWFMTFPDFKAYCQAREQALSDYENRTAWARKMLINISKAGYFSSDRTIEEYNRDIWKLDTGLVP